MTVLDRLPVDREGWYLARHNNQRIRISPYVRRDDIDMSDWTEEDWSGTFHMVKRITQPGGQGKILENVFFRVVSGDNVALNSYLRMDIVSNGRPATLYYLGRGGNEFGKAYLSVKHYMRNMDLFVDAGSTLQLAQPSVATSLSSEYTITYRDYVVL